VKRTDLTAENTEATEIAEKKDEWAAREREGKGKRNRMG
jgi:hypothetical protein